MKAYLVRFSKWLLVKLAPEMELIINDPPIMARVRELVEWADTLVGAAGQVVNGERKRAQVLSKLVVEYPDYLKKDLALLIERAVQEKE